MICPIASVTSTNHHHGSVTTAPVTPERQVITTFEIAVAVRVAEAHCRFIASPVVRVAGSSTCVTVPCRAVPEVAETCYEASEGSTANAAAGL